MNNWKTPQIKELFNALELLETRKERESFFRDLCTISELQEFAKRWSAAKMLHQKLSIREIAQKTGLSTTTVSRVGQWKKNLGEGGYNLVLERITKKEKKEEIKKNNMIPMKLENFEAIIWDMDGVIVDSESIWQVEEPQWIMEKFPKFSHEDCKQFMGQSPKGVFDILKKQYPKLDWEEFFEAQKNLALEKVYPYAKIFPGVKDCLQKIQQTHPQAISSSALEIWIDDVIGRNNLESFFDHIISAEEIGGISKPDPAIFLHTAKKLNISPEKCLVLEDSKNGIIAGKKAGMRVGVFISDSNRDRDTSGGDFYFEKFSDLLK